MWQRNKPFIQTLKTTWLWKVFIFLEITSNPNGWKAQVDILLKIQLQKLKFSHFVFSAVRKRWWRPQSFYYDNYQFNILIEWQFGLRIILSRDIDETQSAARQSKKEDTRAWKAFHVRNRIPSYRQCQLTAGIGNWFGYNASFLFGPLFGK